VSSGVANKQPEVAVDLIGAILPAVVAHDIGNIGIGFVPE
jgi:hypothetical protein